MMAEVVTPHSHACSLCSVLPNRYYYIYYWLFYILLLSRCVNEATAFRYMLLNPVPFQLAISWPLDSLSLPTFYTCSYCTWVYEWEVVVCTVHDPHAVYIIFTKCSLLPHGKNMSLLVCVCVCVFVCLCVEASLKTTATVTSATILP